MTTLRGSLRPWVHSASAMPIVSAPLRALGRSGLLPRAVWRRLPAGGTCLVRVAGASPFLYRAGPNDAVGRGLFWRGGASWEPETTALFARLARGAGTVLDVGANTGLFTLLALASGPDCRVVAFEPVPRTHRLLLEQVALNGWSDRCEARSSAASDAPGIAEFHVPFEDYPTSASLDPSGFRGMAGESIRVVVEALDDAIPPGTRVGLAKIDVEGFEDRALRGMRRILEESRPHLVVECNPDGPFSAVESLLIPLGYRFFHLSQRGPRRVDRIVPDSCEHARNYLAIARECPGLEPA